MSLRKQKCFRDLKKWPDYQKDFLISQQNKCAVARGLYSLSMLNTYHVSEFKIDLTGV